VSALGVSPSVSIHSYSPTMNLESLKATKDECSTTAKTDNFVRNWLLHLSGIALNIASIFSMHAGAITVGWLCLAGALTCYAISAIYGRCFPVEASKRESAKGQETLLSLEKEAAELETEIGEHRDRLEEIQRKLLRVNTEAEAIRAHINGLQAAH